MDSPKIVYKYYSNPAFCAQSEAVYVRSKRIVSPSRQRMPPLGANSPRNTDCNRIMRTDISDNPLRMTSSLSAKLRDDPPELPPKPAKFMNRSFQRQTSMICKPPKIIRSRTRSEDLEMAQFRQRKNSQYERNTDDELDVKKHRYEVIRDDFDDILDYSPTKKRIVQADDDDISEYNVDAPDDREMKEVPSEIVTTVNGKTHRYAIVPCEDDDLPKKANVTFTSPVMSKKNLIATQKLHELLSTPRKLKSYASQPSVRITPNKRTESIERYVATPKKIISSTPTNIHPSKSCANLSTSRGNATSPISPKAQQQLNYGLPDYERDIFVTSFREKSRDRSFEEGKDRRERRGKSLPKEVKTTAVIQPRVASPPSVYSEETYKSFTSIKAVNSATASLTIAALMLTLCGGLTTGLSFYMMYSVGRRYYLDFGVLAGFTSFLLGLLGFRKRRHQLLPNRNYISGYIVLSSFALLSSLGLLILLSLQPHTGTPLNDITSGAVCGVSILSLTLASFGVVASYCCVKDPPDNRVGATQWVASPPSVYSEETYKSFTSIKAVNSATASLTIAALMLTLCGGLTTGLSFYMMYSVGRRYYLDFGVLAGFTSFLLGLLGFRKRRHQLLPNRNYISGYIVLSSFALLSSLGLLILLSLQPHTGTPLNDITSGAVCGVSILSLTLASFGVVASYCCVKDPPDNRVGATQWVASPPSVYSEETYKSFTSIKAVNSATASLTIAALMLTLCGGLTTGLSFYMMYSVGRRYYLDFGVLAGFTSFLLGLLGFRKRRHQLLPNRNYISGYIVLSSFALLSSLGLLILLSLQPHTGTPLNDITSGAVCGVSILSLTLASFGVVASYCCVKDPPDNRVGATQWY